VPAALEESRQLSLAAGTVGLMAKRGDLDVDPESLLNM